MQAIKYRRASLYQPLRQSWLDAEAQLRGDAVAQWRSGVVAQYVGYRIRFELRTTDLNIKYTFLYSAVSSRQDCSKRFYTLLPWQTCSIRHNLNLYGKHPTSNHAAVNARRLFVHNYPPLYIARYARVQLSELEQCIVEKRAQGLTRQHRIRTRVFLVYNPRL